MSRKWRKRVKSVWFSAVWLLWKWEIQLHFANSGGFSEIPWLNLLWLLHFEFGGAGIWPKFCTWTWFTVQTIILICLFKALVFSSLCLTGFRIRDVCCCENCVCSVGRSSFCKLKANSLLSLNDYRRYISFSLFRIFIYNFSSTEVRILLLMKVASFK